MHSAELNIPQNHVYLFKPHDYAQQSFPKSRLFWYNTHCQKRERI